VQRTESGVRLTVRVQPRSSVTQVTGVQGDALRVRVTAAPVDGAANEALVQLLSETFDIPRRSVTIVAGAGSRTKVVELVGLTEERVRRIVES
jgi:uncharacterized protein (TIGR00251 family)